jgi:glutathione S-transferase
MYNARRFDVPLEKFPKLVAAVDHCNQFDAFRNAAPESQPDAT